MTTTDSFAAADWIDVSVPLRPGVATFPGDPTYNIELAVAIASGAICNISRLDMGAHTGTHLDAPSHFIDGAAGTETIPLDVCIGPAWVVDATSLHARISAADLGGLDIPAGETRLLFKTPNSELWNEPGFSDKFIGLGEDGARLLVERGIRLVGADYLSIAPFGDPVATHQALLGAGLVILEGLDLREVSPGPVDLLCLPLRLVGSDGVPARALVRPRS
jgi:arylformamidase